MFMTKQLAEEITSEIKKVTPFYFMVADENGVLLDCTNATRVGTTHEGAVRMIQEDTQELYVYQDNEYPGCTQGVVLSLRFGGKIVGFIGVRGIPEEIISYGRIIQRLTELLVHQKFEKTRYEATDQMRLVLINALVYGEVSETYFDVNEELFKYGIDIRKSFTTAVIHYQSVNQEEETQIVLAKIKLAKRYVLNQLEAKKILAAHNKEMAVMVSNLTPKKLYKNLKELLTYVEEFYNLKLLAVVSVECPKYTDIVRRYNETLAMTGFLKEMGECGVHYYNPCNLHFLLRQFPTNYQEQLEEQLFNGLTKEEKETMIAFIQQYIDCNGSLNKLADMLFLHKNSVQYKMKKIKDKTGLDVRQFKDLVILIIACGIDNEK